MPDSVRKACIIGLLGINYANRIMLSHGYVPHLLGRPWSVPDVAKQMLADAYQKLGLISTNMEPYDKQQPAGPADAGSGDEQQDGEN